MTTMTATKKKSPKAAKAPKTVKAGKAPHDDRERLDLTKLKEGDKVVMLSGSRAEWLKAGMVGEFRGVDRKTLARVKFEKGTTLVGSKNLRRQ